MTTRQRAVLEKVMTQHGTPLTPEYLSTTFIQRVEAVPPCETSTECPDRPCDKSAAGPASWMEVEYYGRKYAPRNLLTHTVYLPERKQTMDVMPDRILQTAETMYGGKTCMGPDMYAGVPKSKRPQRKKRNLPKKAGAADGPAADGGAAEAAPDPPTYPQGALMLMPVNGSRPVPIGVCQLVFAFTCAMYRIDLAADRHVESIRREMAGGDGRDVVAVPRPVGGTAAVVRSHSHLFVVPLDFYPTRGDDVPNESES
jgi:hypothetical protein